MYFLYPFLKILPITFLLLAKSAINLYRIIVTVAFKSKKPLAWLLMLLLLGLNQGPPD